MKTKIILAGGSGFLGNVLTNDFAARGMEVVNLTRWPKQRPDTIREVRWDGTTVEDWRNELNGARALINRAGPSMNCGYHERVD